MVIQIVTAPFIRGKRLNISTIFVTWSYFWIWKYQSNERFSKSHLVIHPVLIIKNLHKKLIAKPRSFLVTDTAVASDDHLFQRDSVRKNRKTNHDNWW